MGIKVTGNSRIDTATAEIAVAIRDARVGQPRYREQDHYDEATRLRDEIMAPNAKLLALVRELASNYHNNLLGAATAMDAIAAALL